MRYGSDDGMPCTTIILYMVFSQEEYLPFSLGRVLSDLLTAPASSGNLILRSLCIQKFKKKSTFAKYSSYIHDEGGLEASADEIAPSSKTVLSLITLGPK